MDREKIIMFGGTFDPIHCGHIQVARAAMKHIEAQQVIWIPARRSPHKQQLPLASDSDRLEMIRRVISACPSFTLSDCELNRPEPSYTLDTVLEFRRQFGPQVELVWLVGADAVRDLPRWYRISEVMDNCTLAVMYRAGYPKPDFTACKPHFTHQQIQKLEDSVIPVPLVDISSTEIRNRLSKGQNVSEMLPPEVDEYIKTRRLYR